MLRRIDEATPAPDGLRQRWSPADLLFLIDARRRGLSDAQVAEFLGRTENEVRQKAKELGITTQP